MSGSAEVLAAVLVRADAGASNAPMFLLIAFDSDETQHSMLSGLEPRFGAIPRPFRQPHAVVPSAFRADFRLLASEHPRSLDAADDVAEYMLSAWVTYRIATTSFSRRVGLWR